MNHLRTFEQFASEYSDKDNLHEFLGMGHKGNDERLKHRFEVTANAWRHKGHFYLYLGGEDFVPLKSASDDDVKKAFEQISKQGEKDKWGGAIGIFGGKESDGKSFLVYKPSSSINYSYGGHGSQDAGVGGLSSLSSQTDKEFKEIGDEVMPNFKKYLETAKVHA